VLAMVEVDVFWAYGLGAGFALAAAHQLQARAERRDEAGSDELDEFGQRRSGFLDNPYLVMTVLFMALVFGPSGAWLLWGFPSWETMHVGTRDLPVWLATGFAVTNVTQGIVGFWVVQRMVEKGRGYGGYLTMVGAYFAMFFILVHGWDGSGFQRFFSYTATDFDRWGERPALVNVGEWLTSPVALTLYGMGLLLIPLLFTLVARWLGAGQRWAVAQGRLDRVRPATSIVAGYLLAAFGFGLGGAIAVSITVRALGAAGIAAFAVAAWFAILRPGALADRAHRWLGLPGRQPGAVCHAPGPGAGAVGEAITNAR
jgi:hypothetical protein